MAKRRKFAATLEPRPLAPQRTGRAADLSTPPAVKLTVGCLKKGKGKSELVFAGEEDAARLGVKPGPAVRLCTGEKARGKPRGHLVHVENVCQASAVASRWAKCAMKATSKEKLEACAREALREAAEGASCPREPYATLHGGDGLGQLGRLGALPSAGRGGRGRASRQKVRNAWDRAAKTKGRAGSNNLGDSYDLTRGEVPDRKRR